VGGGGSGWPKKWFVEAGEMLGQGRTHAQQGRGVYIRNVGQKSEV